MPTYSYRCQDCDETFDHVSSMEEHERSVPSCPQCSSNNVEQVLAPFFAQTTRKS
jgi:putative FmdB family regulatory protein